MSFVGICICKDGLVGFADSKSSIETGLGSAPDPEREYVRKIFRFPDYILCTYGAGTFFSKRGDKVYLEDWFAKYTGISISMPDLLFLLQEDIAQHPDNQGTQIQFILGGVDCHGLYVQYAGTDFQSVTFQRKKRALGVYTGGISFYTSKTRDLITNNSCTLCRDMLPSQIKDLVRQGDRYGVYNPVGGEILTEMILI